MTRATAFWKNDCGYSDEGDYRHDMRDGRGSSAMGIGAAIVVVLLVVLVICFFIKLFKPSGFSCSGISARRSQTKGTKKLSSEKEMLALVASEEIVVILFYADWCSHCTAFKPEFEKASKDTELLHVKFAMIDGHKILGESISKYNIKGYPTIVVSNKGKLQGELKITQRDHNGIKRALMNQPSHAPFGF